VVCLLRLCLQVAPLAGGIVAALLFRLTNDDSFRDEGDHASRWMQTLSKCLMEFIGTFYLVLTISLTPLAGSNFGPIAIGLTLMAMVFAGGHVSGALYNPAVTLGIFLHRKDLLRLDGFLYFVVVQCAAATAAAAAGHGLGHQLVYPFPMAPYSVGQSFAAEAVFTMALVTVVLNVATTKGNDGNYFFGLAIGFTVLAGAATVSPISGAAFNPAVATGLSIVAAIHSDANVQYLWVYWVRVLPRLRAHVGWVGTVMLTSIVLLVV